ncbi:MAG: DUF2971 domain-containing protein [Proteobacteria bacterium]|nr:DUF2971 domain-containing protein [Pseudomonadota bacterium]
MSERFWSEWLTDEDPILYHYTDAVGLCGIVESTQLWLTSSAYLNDATENQHAGVLLRRALHKIRARDSGEREAAFYDYLDVVFHNAQSSPRLDIDKQTFVCCFSTRKDSLSQWRGYGGGEGGFSIGFKASALWDLKHSPALEPGFWLLPCDYDEDRLTQLNQSFIEEALRECLDDNPNASDADIAAMMAIGAQWIGAAIKHPAFSDEKEWRLIYYGFGSRKPKISYRGNSTITPYTKFEFGSAENLRKAIAEVWVGPQRHPELAASALKDFLSSKLDGDVLVKVSDTPYRRL